MFFDTVFASYGTCLTERWHVDGPTDAHSSRVLRTRQELHALFRMRADIFQHKGRRGYDSRSAQLFIESCDEGAVQTASFQGSEMVRSLRLQRIGTIASNANYAALWSAVAGHCHPDDLLMTRFASAGRRRGLSDIFELFQLNYRIGLLAGAEQSFLTAAPGYEKFFTRVGYLPLLSYTCPRAGDQLIMRLDAHDIAHLRRVRSPFATVYEEISLASAKAAPCLEGSPS